MFMKRSESSVGCKLKIASLKAEKPEVCFLYFRFAWCNLSWMNLKNALLAQTINLEDRIISVEKAFQKTSSTWCQFDVLPNIKNCETSSFCFPNRRRMFRKSNFIILVVFMSKISYLNLKTTAVLQCVKTGSKSRHKRKKFLKRMENIRSALLVVCTTKIHQIPGGGPTHPHIHYPSIKRSKVKYQPHGGIFKHAHVPILQLARFCILRRWF